MITEISIGILIGIIATLIYTNIISVWIDLKLEVYKYKVSEQATFYKLKSERQVHEFNKEYPQSSEDSSANMIGFHMDSQEEYEDDEDDDFEYQSRT